MQPHWERGPGGHTSATRSEAVGPRPVPPKSAHPGGYGSAPTDTKLTWLHAGKQRITVFFSLKESALLTVKVTVVKLNYTARFIWLDMAGINELKKQDILGTTEKM